MFTLSNMHSAFWYSPFIQQQCRSILHTVCNIMQRMLTLPKHLTTDGKQHCYTSSFTIQLATKSTWLVNTLHCISVHHAVPTKTHSNLSDLGISQIPIMFTRTAGYFSGSTVPLRSPTLLPRSNRSKCSNDPYLPYLQDFFAVLSTSSFSFKKEFVTSCHITTK